MWSDEAKQKVNEQSEAEMRTFLRSKSWPEKVRSIERMNEFARKAKGAMAETLRTADIKSRENQL